MLSVNTKKRTSAKEYAMLEKQLVYAKSKNEPLRVYIDDIQSWDGIDELIKFVQISFQVRILKKHDGADARIVILEGIDNDF